MAKQRISVELDDDTIRHLAPIGDPAEILTRLANSAADAARRPAASQRDGTDASLRVERNTGERAHADTLVIDQREANAQMVRATIRAQERAEEAQAAEERAVESERELRVVAEFRELFIGILGHDLRNPLTAISMGAGMLLGAGRLNEQDARTVTRIVNSSQRMTLMIAQLLDLTRARLGGGLPLEVRHSDLQDVCQRVVEEFGKAVQLDVEGDVTGTWDPDRLAAALSNLVGNAIEHATPGAAVIVRAYADGSDVVVEVSNEGNPIPAHMLPFIFEPFRRAQQREKSATGNLGLGLYIASQIALAHGGTLGTHSAEGKTIFVMRLPRSLS
jgi:signal transduction histidine kinase